MMRRLIFVIVLAIYVVQPAPSVAEPTPSTDEIVVTARRTPEKSSDSAANITVLTAGEIARLPASSLNDVLNTVPGLDIQERSLAGYPASISIQGGNPAHTRIMVDGILLNTQLNAFANPSLIPLGNVERIEVIKGTASSAWGSSLGGVINVITKSPRPVPGKIINGNITMTGGGGAIGLWQESLEISGQPGRIGFVVWENQRRTYREFRDNSDFLGQDLSAKLTYDLNPITNLFAGYHHTRQRIGGYEFETLGYGDDYGYNVNYGTLGAKLAPSRNLYINAALKSSDQTSRLNEFTVPAPNTPIQSVTSRNVFTGLDINAELRRSDNESIAGGLDLGQDRLSSDQVDGPQTLGRYAGYASYQRRLMPSLGLEAGARYDRTQAYGGQFSPSLGGVYHLPRDTNLRLSISRAFNAPPLIYRFIKGNPFVIPNADLKAERAYVAELSAESPALAGLAGLWGKIGIYRAEVSDLVNIVEIVPFTTYQAQNVDKTRRQGMEADVKYNITRQLTCSTGFAYNRIQDRVTGQLIQPGGSSRTTYKLGLEYSAPPRRDGPTGQPALRAALQGDYRFWNMPLASQSQDRKFIWDAHLSYDLKGVTGRSADVFINLFNIFNRQYYYDALLPSPGRRIEAGVKYNF